MINHKVHDLKSKQVRRNEPLIENIEEHHIKNKYTRVI